MLSVANLTSIMLNGVSYVVAFLDAFSTYKLRLDFELFFSEATTPQIFLKFGITHTRDDEFNRIYLNITECCKT